MDVKRQERRPGAIGGGRGDEEEVMRMRKR